MGAPVLHARMVVHVFQIQIAPANFLANAPLDLLELCAKTVRFTK